MREESRLTPEVTVRDCPIPRLPVKFAFPQTSSLLEEVVAPIPKLPEELMKVVLVPEFTWKVNNGLVVPIPIFPLSKTVNPCVKFDPVVCSVIAVLVPAPWMKALALPY